MKNYFHLFGTLTQNLTMSEHPTHQNHTYLHLAVMQDQENEDGEFDHDFITLDVKGDLALYAVDYLKEGDRVLVSGEVRSATEIEKHMHLDVKKLTFISKEKKK